MKNSIKSSIVAALIILFGTNLIMAQTPISFDLDLSGSDAVKTATQAGVTLTASANGDLSLAKNKGGDFLDGTSVGIWVHNSMTNTDSFTFSFDNKVTIYSMNKTNGLADDAGDNTLIVSYSNGRTNDIFTPQNPPHQASLVFTTPVVLEAGETMTFNVQNLDGTGSYRISSLSLIPEPSTYALILGASVLVFIMCRRYYGGKKQP